MHFVRADETIELANSRLRRLADISMPRLCEGVFDFVALSVQRLDFCSLAVANVFRFLLRFVMFAARNSNGGRKR